MTTTPATHMWRPSNARYLQIEGFVPTPRGPILQAVTALAWPQKDPGDTLDYVFDIAPALSADCGDAISALDVFVSPSNAGDLTIVSSSVDGARVILWLAGGQAGTTYTITLSVTTNGGRTLLRSISLPVVALATVPVTAATLTTPSGQPLTDPSGIPLTIS